MKTPAALVLALALAASPVAQAQELPAAQQAAVQQLLNEQLRRIEALEARLAQLQQELGALRGQGQLPAAAEPNPEAHLQEPFEHPFDGDPPMDPTEEAPNADVPRALAVDFYGSLRILSAHGTDGHSEVRNNFSRLGIRGEKQLFERLTGFARYEMGVNLVAGDQAILLVSGDPGTPIGQGNQPIVSRLGYVGIGTPYGNVSWGKQWAPYYDVAEFTDQMVVFGGAASGAFGAGTDGGIAGTGRAERAVLYRNVWGPLAVGLQVQNRIISPNDRGWADTYSGSIVVGRQMGFAVGAAYNKVRDGVIAPTLNQPFLGDEASVFGARYRHEWFYAGAIFSILKQHEVDDLRRPFDGNGFELALRQHLTTRLWVEGVFNNLRPDSDHPGEYRVRFGVTNLVYRWGEASRAFIGFRLEDSRRVDGSDLTESTFAAGLNYTF